VGSLARPRLAMAMVWHHSVAPRTPVRFNSAAHNAAMNSTKPAHAFEIGVCVPIMQYGPERTTPRWPEIKQIAINAEQMGIDTLWIPDELLWRGESSSPRGFCDGVSMAGAVAAVTSKIKIGTWVLSTLHRNAGIIAKTAETLDEISEGRFVFGLGAGHAGDQAHTFGLPEDLVMSRYEEALQIILPLMRGGRATFEGKYHSAHDLVQAPVGPRPNAIPLLIGGQRPKTLRLAAMKADIWSTYAAESNTVDELGPRMESFDAICEEVGRDPASVGRAAGLSVQPLDVAGDNKHYIAGSADEIADSLRTFRDVGFTQVDLMLEPGTVRAFDALAPVVELLRAN
jgi:alkanesulfonate monooxygenase SsuD/methylene tetrahydromethanopterin reductase-like flavin-dependent oxidoreductase (luciferase family)